MSIPANPFIFDFFVDYMLTVPTLSVIETLDWCELANDYKEYLDGGAC